jgi:hypothetical protein
MTMTDASPPAPRHVLGALALELAPAPTPSACTLPQRDAGALAALMAQDLARQHGDAAMLQLATVAAHYDPVELLRPGWPLHGELQQLSARAPGSGEAGGGRVVAFGTHHGTLPGALRPNADFLGGPLRLVPFVLDGDADVAGRVASAYEAELMERGMASAATALAMQEAFGLRIEHARYLTLHDLCAMTALQYEHAGLAPLWPIVETALLAPEREAWVDAPPEPLLRYTEHEARIALFSPQGWRQRYAGSATSDQARLQRDYARFEARQKQYAHVLQAHAVQVNFVHCSADAPAEL